METLDFMAAHVATEDDGASDGLPFFDITPSLYRANAFRLLGLPQEATSQDIRRKADLLRMSETLGTPLPQGRAPLPLDDPPTVDEVRDALQRLRDPERRIIEELFWFWPVEPGRSVDDAALTALAQGDFAKACQIWRNTEAGGIGLHNLAVLTHALALDHERDVTRQNVMLTADDQLNVSRLWRQAFLDWNAAIREEPFWGRLNRRVQEIDDPRLTSATVTQIRQALPLGILSISAKLAVQAGERPDSADGARHLAVLNGSGFDRRTCNEALRLALGPVKQQIQTLCSTAESDANADPTHADQVVSRLLDQTAPLLATVDFLPAGHSMRDATHDQLALAALSCVISYGNKTEDWQGSLVLLERTLAIAASDSSRSRIQRNIDIFTSNLTYEAEVNTCWFCTREKPDEGAASIVKMHGDVIDSGFRVNWRVLDVPVPRCKSCKRKHSSAEPFATLAFLSLAIAGFTVCGVGNAEGAALATGWVCFFAAFAIFRMVKQSISKGVKDEGSATMYPRIGRLKKEGWALGAKPAGVE